MSLTRDSLLWTLGLVGAVLGYVAADQAPEHAIWMHRAQDALFVLGIVSGYLKNSPLPTRLQALLREQVKAGKQ